MFTDVVGSTAIRAELGEDRADRFRREHDEALLPCIEANRGSVVKGQGDGVMAVFDAAADALAAAVAVQQAVDRLSRDPSAAAPFQIRIGLSVGDLTWEDDDCHGMPVVEARRLESAAEPGQILCSDFVRAMARGRGGHEFRPVGELDLKGIPEPVVACEVERLPLADTGSAQLELPRRLQLNAAGMRFVGRGGEVDAVLAHLGAQSGLRFAWITGEPGIGKTRLAAEVAARLHAKAANVLFGRSGEDLEVPFQPFVEALAAYADATPDDLLADRLGQAQELARLLPELRDRLPGLGPPTEGTPDEERYRLFEAVRAWLRAAAADRPLVVVLDDVHWATEPTLSLLSHLARSGEAADVAVLATLRNTEHAPTLQALLDELAHDPSSLLVGLRGLPLDSVAELVGDDRAELVLQETAGNPLFVGSLLGQSGGGSGDVRAAVRRRVDRLSEGVRSSLRLAALTGLEFDVRVVAEATSADVLDIIDQLEPAIRAGLVAEVSPNVCRFEHAVVRGVLRDEVGATRRAHQHLAIAKALEAVAPDRVGQLAHHYAEAAAVGLGTEAALGYLERSAELATTALAYEEAVADYQRLLPLLGRDLARRASVYLALGDTQRALGQFGAASASFHQACVDARDAGSAALMAEAAAEQAETSGELGRGSELAIDFLEESARQLDELSPSLRLRVMSRLAGAHSYLGRVAEATTAYEAATELARGVDDHFALFEFSLAGARVLLSRPDRLEEQLRLSEDAWAHSTHLRHHLQYRAYGAWNVAVCRLQMGDGRGAREAAERGLAVARRQRHTLGLHILTALRSALELTAGDLDAAERSAGEADELSRLINDDPMSGPYGVQMFSIRREQGRLHEVAPLLRLAASQAAQPSWRPGWAAVTAELGMLDEARAQLEGLVVDSSIDLPEDVLFGASISYLAEACCALGDRRRAAVLYEAMLDHERLAIVVQGVACYGPAARYLGKLAATMGDAATAERHLLDALDFCDRLESPLWRAHCQFDLGRLRSDRDLIEAAQATAAELGMGGLLAKIEALP